MNDLSLKITEYEVPEYPGVTVKGIEFEIDGEDILSMVGRQHPEVLAAVSSGGSGHPRWIGIGLDLLQPTAANFTGIPDDGVAGNLLGRVPIATCSDCAIFWCDNIAVRITRIADRVVWNGFCINPHLNPVPLTRMPQLEFDRLTYDQVFSALPLE